MNLSSLATNALATTRSTFKGLAEAAVPAGDETAAKTPAQTERTEATPVVKVEASVTKPKGVRRGVALDAYA
ncbi:hypothetical protein ACIA5C_13590 [Actinoplanes sp. NPDC051343]|uniref:hypothetical protein n=1 Tax=Actinoplanes sp. NPDC051343 TaxID=3363906 RepID=UPI00379F5A21